MVMWIGLAIRIWAVLVLGSAFRTTVEVDATEVIGQPYITYKERTKRLVPGLW